MKKKECGIKVFRTNVSTYQNSDFFLAEKKAIENIVLVNKSFQIRKIEYAGNTKNVDSADVLITNTHTNFNELQQKFSLKKTKLILHPNSGYDNFDIEFVKNFQGTIILGNVIRECAVSEYIISSIFKHYANIPDHKIWDQKRKWERKLLKNQKILILGYGHIGKKVTEILTPLLHEEIVIVDPFYKNLKLGRNTAVKASYSQIKNRVFDIIIVACSLNATSRKLVNKNFLKDHLSNNGLLINTARGEIVDENDLINSLKKNKQQFACLDVFQQEPFDSRSKHYKKLLSHKNINTTSHIAGVYKNIDQEIINYEVKIIKDYFDMQKNAFEKKYKNVILKNRVFKNFLI